MENPVDLWNDFRALYSKCIGAGIEKFEDRQFAGKFWAILWRLKDEAVKLHKLTESFVNLLKKSHLLNSYKQMLTLQVLFINEFFEKNPFYTFFFSFQELVQTNEHYVKYIIHKNKGDSSNIWIFENGDKLFPKLEENLNECRQVWMDLKHPKKYNDYSEQSAKEILDKYGDFFDIIGKLSNGLEWFVDRIFDGSRRGEVDDEYLKPNDFKTNLSELVNQFNFINDLYKTHFYDVIPFKIRLILEYCVNILLLSFGQQNLRDNFNTKIRNLKMACENAGKRFLESIDQDRLHHLKDWGNFTAHDIFPAISRQELADKQPMIIRLIKELIKINTTVFWS